MVTTINLRRILDRAQWEMCTPAPVATAAGAFVVSSSLHDQYQFLVSSVSVVNMYDPAEDGWMAMPSPALAGTFGAGACGVHHPWGPTGTCSGTGTTTTLLTTLTLARDLRGYKVRITGGTNAGEERTIASNTIGANATITVTSAFSNATTNTTAFTLITGRLYLLNAGTIAAGSFKYYDFALNTWTSAANSGLPATLGTDAKLVSAFRDEAYASGTATSATATTLVNSAKSWATNSWTNYLVRITGGTGAGQIRVISSNTGTTLTVATWTVTPDATSTYEIRSYPYIYLLGNNAVTMYRYDIPNNTWSTLSPGAARAGAPVSGMSANIVNDVTDAAWNDENNIINGKYIYSWRGTGLLMDRYNIPGNTWESALAYAPGSESIVAASSHCYFRDYIYSILGNTGRMVKFNLIKQATEPHGTLLYVQGAAVVGDKLFGVLYTDGAAELHYIYTLTHTQTFLFRSLNF